MLHEYSVGVSQTSPIRDAIKLEKTDVRMTRWMCNVKSEDKISAEELRTRLKLNMMRECLPDKRLPWLGHLEIGENAWSIKTMFTLCG